MSYRKNRITVIESTLFTLFTRFTEFTRFTQFARFTRFVEFKQSKHGKLGKLSELCKLGKLCELSIFCFMILFCFFTKDVDAKVKGRCKDCHSMHSSTPSPVLTRGGCVGCHGQAPAGTQNIITIGKAKIPQVLHHMENGDLAGGNFYNVADGYNPDYSKGHNVLGISLPEYLPTMHIPPGFIEDVVIPGGRGPAYWPDQKQLTCSGMWGCHGDRTLEDPYKSIYSAHHTDDRAIDGSTVGRSYRFLYGIKGKEHQDWEYQATIENHNGYKGDITYSTMDTISYLCGECHAKFHRHPNLGGSRDAALGLLVGHPADISFSTVHGGYAGSEYQGYSVYSLESPVAYSNPTGGETVVYADSIVMCLSCHRPHASPYPDSMRWDYEKISLGDTRRTGCLVCHTRK